MTRRTFRRRIDARSAVIQCLVVFAIVGSVTAVGIPVYTSRAKASVLRQNAHALELQVKGYLALDLDLAYIADDQADGASAGQSGVSTAIARALRAGEAGGSGRYVNSFGGSRAIVCQTASPEYASGGRPAVWITDDQRYAYGAFTPSATTRSRLAGTLVVVFILDEGRTSAVDIFYVVGAGMRSPAVATLAP